MSIDDLVASLVESKKFSASTDGGLLLVHNLDTESDYVVEQFDGSFQIRQAICFDCLEWGSEDILSLHRLCSMTNERFSGCKIFIDRWGALVMASDVLRSVVSADFIETMLDQTEFMSQAMLNLVEIIRERGGPVTEDDLDEALAAPSLQ